MQLSFTGPTYTTLKSPWAVMQIFKNLG